MQNVELIIEIDGFKIKTNSLYKIKNKPDADAPSGLKKEGTTKIPSEEVEDIVPGSKFIQTNPKGDPSEGIWDTGLYEESFCYHTWDKDRAVSQVESLKKYIIEPYGNKYGGKDKLEHIDDNYWGNKSVSLKAKKVFNTAKIDDLLDLYLVIKNGSLTPVGQEGNPAYNNSNYVVVDNDQNTEYQKEMVNSEMDAMVSFAMLLTKSKEELVNVLFYRELTVNDKLPDSTLKFTFKEWLNKDIQNAVNFNKFIESYNSDDKIKEKVTLYRILKNLHKKESRVKKHSGGKFLYKDTEIGEDLKQAAENIINNKELEEIKDELFNI